MKLLQELFANGILSEEKMAELKKEIEKTGKKEEEIILEKKIFSEDALFELKSKIFKIPLKKIKPEDVPVEILELIPEEASLNYEMIALAKKDNVFQIGMVYPEDISAQNALRFLANQEKFNYQIYLLSLKSFQDLARQRKNMGAETKKFLAELDKEKVAVSDAPVKKSSPRVFTEDAPVIKMVQVILRHAIEGDASDIHIEPGRENLTIRFRQNGILRPGLFLPMSVHASVVARIKILAGLKIDENRIPQDGRFSDKINDADFDFRVATFPTLYGEKVELRVLDPSAGARTFEDLGLSGRNLEIVKTAIKKPYGMILFTGPTGSGKTTTQYAILRILNQDSVNIVTVEDPIEYSIAGINQSQVRPEIGYTFAHGLRQILRQDPNVIMVGEIRDEETANLAINAALTGHVVLSTLHTNSAVGVVARLIDMGIRPFLIPSALRIVISQRLVRVLCNKCKTKIRPVEKVKNYLLSKAKTLPPEAENEVKIEDPLYIYKAKGCEACSQTGYLGRMGLFEVFFITDEIAELILKNPIESELFKSAQRQGMISMEQAGVIEILKGKTSMEEVTRVTEEK